MPNVTVDFIAKFAQFQDALELMGKKTDSVFGKMNSGASALKTTLATIGVSLSVGAFGAFVKGAIDAADHLNDLSKRTGIAVETLGGLGFAAKQSGGDLEGFVSAADKLNRSIAEAATGQEKKSEVFKSLGIDVRDATGALKTADVVMIELANKFEGYADGPNKVAIALALLGKAGAEQIAVLNEGGRKIQENIDYYKRFSGVTKDVAERSDKFNDELAKLHLLSGALGTKIASELLGPLQKVAEALLEAKEKGTAFDTVARGLAVVFGTLAVAASGVALGYQQTFSVLAALSEAIDAPVAEKNNVWKRWKAQAIEATDAWIEFRNVMVEATAARDHDVPPTDAEIAKKKPDAPGISDKASEQKAAALAKAIADLDAAKAKVLVDIEKQLATQRLAILESFYKDGLIDEARFWQTRSEIQRTAYELEAAGLAKAIAAREQEVQRTGGSKGDPKTKENAEARKSLVEDEEKLGKLRRDYGAVGITDLYERIRATKLYGEAVRAQAADMLEVQGQTEAAERIRIELRLAGLRKEAVARKDAAAVEQLDDYEIKLQKLAKFAALRVESDAIALRAARDRDDINNDRSLNDVEKMNALDAATARTAAQFAELQVRVNDLANNSGIPAIVNGAFEMETALRNVIATGDQLGLKLKATFEDVFTNEFSKVIEGTQSIADAFKNMARSILSEIAKIQSKNLAKAITGSESGDAFTSFLSNLFRGGASTSGSAAFAGSSASITGYAMGTDYVPHTGLYKLHQGEEVIPAGQGKGSVNVYQNIQVDARSDIASVNRAMLAAKNAAVAEIVNRQLRGYRT